MSSNSQNILVSESWKFGLEGKKTKFKTNRWELIFQLCHLLAVKLEVYPASLYSLPTQGEQCPSYKCCDICQISVHVKWLTWYLPQCVVATITIIISFHPPFFLPTWEKEHSKFLTPSRASADALSTCKLKLLVMFPNLEGKLRQGQWRNDWTVTGDAGGQAVRGHSAQMWELSQVKDRCH